MTADEKQARIDAADQALEDLETATQNLDYATDAYRDALDRHRAAVAAINAEPRDPT